MAISIPIRQKHSALLANHHLTKVDRSGKLRQVKLDEEIKGSAAQSEAGKPQGPEQSPSGGNSLADVFAQARSLLQSKDAVLLADAHAEVESFAMELVRWLMEQRVRRAPAADWCSGLRDLKATCKITDVPLQEVLVEYLNSPHFEGQTREIVDAETLKEFVGLLNGLLERTNVQPRVPQLGTEPKRRTSFALSGNTRTLSVSHRETSTGERTMTAFRVTRGSTLPEKFEFCTRKSERSR